MAYSWAKMTNKFIQSKASETPRQLPTSDWKYLALRDGSKIVDPVMGFYLNAPPNAACRWSTDYGAKPPQNLPRGTSLPRRKLHLWNDEMLVAKATVFKKKYWEEMKMLVRPERFEDLYEYFDAATLWFEGAFNLWNLVNMLVTDAHEQYPKVAQDFKPIVEGWIYDLLYHWPNAAHNQYILCNWSGFIDPLTLPFGQDFRAEVELHAFDRMELDVIREALIAQYYHLTGKTPNVPQFYPYYTRPYATATSTPVDIKTEIVHQPANSAPALSQRTQPVATEAERTEPYVSRQDDLSLASRKSSPSGLLTSIPEESAAAKAESAANHTVIVADGSTIKTVVTLAQSQESSPLALTIVNEPASPRCDTTVDQKDGNGVRVKTRQLSTVSAPEEQSEPMLDATEAKRIVSPAPSLPVASPLEHTFPLKSVPMTLNRTSQVPRRDQRNSPPRNVSNQGQSNINTPAYYPTPSMNPQGPQTYAYFQPPQQVVPPLGGPNGLPKPSLNFGTRVSGTQYGANVFMPSGSSPPNGGAPPMGLSMGPTTGPFQNQVSMLPHQIDQQQFNQAQGPSNNASPPYMASQIAMTPVYQPRGHIYQPQPNSGGYTNKKNGNRRNSVNSNGSRKIRDDPVHGPVYSLKQQRKNSNASSGRRPSTTMRVEPGITILGSTACKNYHSLTKATEMFDYRFEECPCTRCTEASRSIYIKYDSEVVNTDQVEKDVMKQFGYLNPLAVKHKGMPGRATVAFPTEDNAIRALQDHQSNMDRSMAAGLSARFNVSYPFYSKYFNAKKRNFESLPRGSSAPHALGGRRYSSSNPTDRRSSNPYQKQPTKEIMTGHTFGSDGTGHERQFDHHASTNYQMMPVYTMPGNGTAFQQLAPPPFRKLWEPSTPTRRGLSTGMALPKNGESVTPKTQAKKNEERTDELLQKEDWRSKPPSEEAISDDGDEFAVVDTASSYSAQGAKSVKVCLPDESGASRSASPEMVEQAEGLKEQDIDTAAEKTEVSGKPQPRSIASSRTITPDPVQPREKSIATDEDKTSEKTVEQNMSPKARQKSTLPKIAQKSSPNDAAEEGASGCRRTTTNLAAPVDSFKQHDTAESNYRKTVNQLSSAVETVYATEAQTVIRRKPRSPLPSAWKSGDSGPQSPPAARQAPVMSNISNRFGEMTRDLAAEMETEANSLFVKEIFSALKLAVPAPSAETTVANATSTTDQATNSQQPQRPKSKSKSKKGKPQHETDKSRSATPSETQSRGPSPAFTQQPTAVAPVDLPGGTSPAMQNNDPSSDGPRQPKKKKISKAKKRNATKSASEVSEGLAKSGGSQEDQQVARQRSPSKEPQTLRPEFAEKSASEVSSVAEKPQVTAEKSQDKTADQAHESDKGNYRANAGGSLHMKKHRSPKKSAQIGDASEHKSPTGGDAISMPTIFEPPTQETKNPSPDANLFPQQKFSIDQMKRDNKAPPPKIKLEPTVRRAHTMKMGAHERIGNLPLGFNPYPQVPPNANSRVWSNIVKGVKSEDPFSADKGSENNSKDWMKDKAVKSPVKEKPARDEDSKTSPTPSPEKPSKTQSQLSASAEPFTSSRSSSPARQLKLNPTAQPFTSSMPSSPALSIASAVTSRTGHGRKGSTYTVDTKGNEQPVSDKRSELPFRPKEGGKNNSYHAKKKASLPGQQIDFNKRYITPAEQVVDPSQVTQPGPPAKGGRVPGRNGPLPDRTGGNVVGAETKPAAATADSEHRQKSTSDRTQAPQAVAAGAPMVSSKDFPTLGQAAASDSQRKGKHVAVVKRPGASASSSSGGVARLVATFEPPVGATAPPVVVKKAAAETQQEAGVEGAWRTVSSNKKTGGSVASRGGGGNGRGGRMGSRGGRAPVGEERKGG